MRTVTSSGIPAGISARLGCALRGAGAGAAGTTALHAATALDMALRGRPASRTPEDSMERLAGRLGVDIPGGDRRADRVSGLATLLGVAAGVTVGAAYGVVRGLGWRPSSAVGALAVTGGALIVGNGPMMLLGVTDPRAWSRTDWLSDLVPHLAFGVVTALTYDAGP